MHLQRCDAGATVLLRALGLQSSRPGRRLLSQTQVLTALKDLRKLDTQALQGKVTEGF